MNLKVRFLLTQIHSTGSCFYQWTGGCLFALIDITFLHNVSKNGDLSLCPASQSGLFSYFAVMWEGWSAYTPLFPWVIFLPYYSIKFTGWMDWPLRLQHHFVTLAVITRRSVMEKTSLWLLMVIISVHRLSYLHFMTWSVWDYLRLNV